MSNDDKRNQECFLAEVECTKEPFGKMTIPNFGVHARTKGEAEQVLQRWAERHGCKIVKVTWR